MDEIKVSIITVCYNSELTIERTIKSVLNQTYKNIEYIIVDGKSSDNTVAIAEKYTDEFDGRMTIISEKDNGIYDAMNKGIKNSSGCIIGIINSDDYYEDNAVEIIVENYKNNISEKLAIYYGGTAMVKDGTVSRVTYSNHELLEKKMITHPSCFVTRAVYDEIGVFDLRYSCVADYDFMLRAKRSGKVTFIPVKSVVANFTLGGMSSTNKAYIDLLHLQMRYGIITKADGYINIFKASLANWMQKHGMEPIRIRKR